MIAEMAGIYVNVDCDIVCSNMKILAAKAKMMLRIILNKKMEHCSMNIVGFMIRESVKVLR